MKKIFILAAVAFACLGLGACNLQSGASVLAQVVSIGEAPACAALSVKTGIAPTLCLDATGNAISIVDYLASKSIKAHLSGGRLYYDGRVAGKGWNGPKV